MEAMGLEWRIRTQNRSTLSVKDLLELLADAGFAWRDLARMLGVSVPAIQKWRKGEKSSGENRLKLAGLIAAIDLIASQFHIQDIESWFEMPIVEGVPVTPIDLWAANQAFLVLEFASGHLNPEEALNRFDPSWRETYDSQFETFRAQDGQMSIRPKG
ncbi:helix-turn-helix transcriptional regulator [Arthrobacter gyeryongensis]|uniref:helix-turn-helix domain-containing protein n=1 Tax=Arthrobacter gyeryongensis TaxID=1650592 RepID=UPI0031EFC5F7